MLEYKNVDGKIIIIYDVDELLATDCAHQMVQRGFENIFVVSKHFSSVHGHRIFMGVFRVWESVEVEAALTTFSLIAISLFRGHAGSIYS